MAVSEPRAIRRQEKGRVHNSLDFRAKKGIGETKMGGQLDGVEGWKGQEESRSGVRLERLEG